MNKKRLTKKFNWSMKGYFEIFHSSTHCIGQRFLRSVLWPHICSSVIYGEIVDPINIIKKILGKLPEKRKKRWHVLCIIAQHKQWKFIAAEKFLRRGKMSKPTSFSYNLYSVNRSFPIFNFSTYSFYMH